MGPLFLEAIRQSAASSIQLSTALRLIEDLMRLGILQETTGFKRNRLPGYVSYA